MPSDRSGHTCSPATASPSRLVASDAARPGTSRSSRLGELARPRRRRCSQLSSTSSSSLRARDTRRCSPSNDRPGRGAHAERGRDDLRPATPRRPPPPAHTTTHRRRNRGSTSAATCTARRVLPTPPVARQRHQPTLVRAPLATASDLLVTSHERRELHRQVPRQRIERPQRRERRVADPGASTWNTRSGRARSRSRCSPRSTSTSPGGRPSRTQLRGRQRHHDLAAMRDRHQPRRPIHRRRRSSRRRAAPPRRCGPPSAPAAVPCTPTAPRQGPLRGDRRVDARRARSRTPRATHHPSSSRHNRRATRPRRARSRRDAPTPPASPPGCSSHRRVEPSRSVNKKVTVPDGNSATPTPYRSAARAQVNQANRTTSPAREGAQNDTTAGPSGPYQNRRSAPARMMCRSGRPKRGGPLNVRCALCARNQAPGPDSGCQEAALTIPITHEPSGFLSGTARPLVAGAAHPT